MRGSSFLTCWARAKLGLSIARTAAAVTPPTQYLEARARKSRRVMAPCTNPSKSFRTSGWKSLAVFRSKWKLLEEVGMAETTRPKHFSMIREFHVADFFTLGNAACGMAAVFCAMAYVGSRDIQQFYWAAWLAPAAFIFDVLDG